MKSPLLFAILAVVCFSQAALAQYEWVDHDGQHVFSDKMPPADIPDANILKQPLAATPQPSADPASAAGETGVAGANASNAEGADAPGSSGQDDELEQKKQEIDQAEQARHEAEEREQQAARADNCERAKRAKRTLASGMRMARINEAGERTVMDDAQRAAELRRTEEIIASNC